MPVVAQARLRRRRCRCGSSLGTAFAAFEVMATRALSDERGRSARHPKEIPPKGWRDIFARVRTEIGSDHVSLVSAGLAMYALLAVFPALAAAIAIYGIFA